MVAGAVGATVCYPLSLVRTRYVNIYLSSLNQKVENKFEEKKEKKKHEMYI